MLFLFSIFASLNSAGLNPGQKDHCPLIYGGKEYFPELTSTGFILGLFSEKAEQAIIDIQQFTEMEVLDICMEDIEGTVLNDTQARQVIENVLQKRPVKHTTGNVQN